MSEVKIGVGIKGNIRGELDMMKRAFEKIANVTKNLKLNIEDRQLNSFIRKMERLENGIKIKISEAGLTQIQGQLENLKIKFKVLDLSNIEELVNTSLGKIKIGLDVSDSELANIRRKIEGLSTTIKINFDVDDSQLRAIIDDSGGSGGSVLSEQLGGDSDGGIASSAAVGALRGGMRGGVIGAGVGVVGAGVTALGAKSLNEYKNEEDVYKYLRQKLGDDELASYLKDSVYNVYRGSGLSDLESIAQNGGMLGKMYAKDNTTDMDTLLSTSAILERNNDIDGKDLFKALNVLNSSKTSKGTNNNLDLIVKAVQTGANDVSGDLMDTIAEFIPQFEAAGFDVEEAIGIIINSVKNGDWNTDGQGNSILEFNNKMSELVTANVKNPAEDVKDAFTDLGFDYEKDIADKWIKGGKGQKDILKQVSVELLKLDANQRRVIGTTLFGTPYEDHMDSILQSYIDGTGLLNSMADNASDLVDEETKTLSSIMTSLGREIDGVFAVVGEDIAELILPSIEMMVPLIRDFAEWLRDSGDETNFLIEGFKMLTPVVLLVEGLFKTLEITLSAITKGVELWEGFMDNLRNKALDVSDIFSDISKFIEKITGFSIADTKVGKFITDKLEGFGFGGKDEDSKVTNTTYNPKVTMDRVNRSNISNSNNYNVGNSHVNNVMRNGVMDNYLTRNNSTTGLLIR